MKKLAFVLVPLLIMALAGLYWLGRAPGQGSDAASAPSSGVITLAPEATPTASASVPDSTAQSTAQPANLPSTSDPDVYAEAVAAVVFGLDTTSAGPEDYRAALLAEADPQMSPRGLADLEQMVAERIPAPELWERMRANGQWSSWLTEDVWQPGAWDEVVTSGLAEPGWAIRNVLGEQTTHFYDGAEARETSRERTITIGMRCPAPGAHVDRCRLTLVGVGVVS